MMICESTKIQALQRFEHDLRSFDVVYMKIYAWCFSNQNINVTTLFIGSFA